MGLAHTIYILHQTDLFFFGRFMKFAFMCHKKCFGISDRFIRSKDTTPSLLHFSTPNISFPLSPAPFAALALNRAGLLTSASKKTPAVKNRTDLW